MGWFNKKKSSEKIEKNTTLPDLPSLPEFPRMQNNSDELNRPLNQLPQFPQSSLGEKFSQNTIKDAITGKKEGDKEVYSADEFAPKIDKMQTMQQPLKISQTHEIPQLPEEEPEEIFPTISRRKFKEEPEEFKEAISRVKKIEPVFIRIDKFEESLKIFEKTKNQITEMEKMLREIQLIKEEEERELNHWEDNLQKIKEEIKKVDNNIFSKLE